MNMPVPLPNSEDRTIPCHRISAKTGTEIVPLFCCGTIWGKKQNDFSDDVRGGAPSSPHRCILIFAFASHNKVPASESSMRWVSGPHDDDDDGLPVIRTPCGTGCIDSRHRRPLNAHSGLKSDIGPCAVRAQFRTNSSSSHLVGVHSG